MLKKPSHLFKGVPIWRRLLSDKLLSSPQRIVLLSFLTVIAIGTFLLKLPSSTHGGISLLDALFTATSATCVTGLVVVNTAETFTLSGQWIILVLIQLGGLGIMTFTTFFMFMLAGKLSITGREILTDTFTQSPIAELSRLIRIVATFTFVLELAGFVVLTIYFLEDYSLQTAAFYGLFHSISAFCNAGFNILPGSYLQHATAWSFNGINILLIISGGLGFIVIYDIHTQLQKNRRQFFRSLSLHTRVVLIYTGLLIAGGALVFFTLEYNQSMKENTWYEKILLSIFQSVTTRTAGFNTVPLNQMGQPLLFFFLALMFIGASPGSCGGGIKTTTFGLFINNLRSQFLNNKDINIYERRIPDETISKATTIIFFSVLTIGLFTFLLMLSEVQFNSNAESTPGTLDILFEVVSAFATVGLSTGITEDLTNFGKVLITVLMYMGRLGAMTLIFALKPRKESNLRYMKGDLIVG
jgi:trk system potassium uptake protein TrkH